jgi:hypothetical protein
MLEQAAQAEYLAAVEGEGEVKQPPLAVLVQAEEAVLAV